jgi:putative ABC transport system permease protein
MFEAESRETWKRQVDNLLRDFRYAFRSLNKNRRFALVAILGLSLGIGASTVAFSVVYNVFVHALPYKNFNRTVVLEMRNLENVGGWRGRAFFSVAEFRAFRDNNHVFEDMIAYDGVRVLYNGGGFIRYWPEGEVVTANTFDYLGVPSLLGRTILPEDGRPGAPPVFVMNYRFWQKEFHGDPTILGQSFILDGKSTTLIGIMPKQFDAFGASFWLPISVEQGSGQVTGRLKTGVSLQAASADLDAIAHRIQPAIPDEMSPQRFAVVAQPLLDSVIGGFKKTLFALLAASLFLLIIACANVANLLLSRATAREREMAMRAALGATRGRMIRQLLVESFVLAFGACCAGCGVAYLSLKIVVALIPAGALPDETVIRMNAPVLLLSLIVAIVTTFLCGLVPALHVVRRDLQPRMTGSGKGAGGSIRHGKFRAALVIGEVAVSILLLVGTGLLIRSFFVLTRVDLGFDPRNVAYFRLDFPQSYSTDEPNSREKKNMLTRQILDRIRSLPGVTAASESMLQPPLAYDWSDTIIPGKPHQERWETRYEIVSEDYFETLGLPLLRGRIFSEDDVNAARFQMVVNQAFAGKYFPSEDPIGRRVKLQVLDRSFLDAPHDTYFEIVGVIQNYKTRDPEGTSWQTFPEVFIPYSVQGFSWRSFMVRTVGDPKTLLDTVDREIRAVDPSVRIAASGTLEGVLKEYYRGPQFEMATVATFAFVGLCLVVIGVFSVMAYTVSLQTHELGIRLALGAQQSSILCLVFFRGLRLISAGVAIGLVASYALTRFLSSQISGVSTTDPWTFAAVLILVVCVCSAACLFPARRAASVDPLVALRYE